ncbi:hypothetical protein EYZ11_013430 [Aspergillus tanneri]|uniref:F-box domain-containing protein n=1 Tax=Aspergillus tanneri TaxID=1220188 RepID=A0A4V3UMF8_9EURO|nr:hypothetical protein EYZ11_013430 [Aspergillus tanneri]
MPLLAFPVEILGLVLENLNICDLWNVYDSCEALRLSSARYLFRALEIRFDRAYPAVLNSRPFPLSPNRLLKMVTQWSLYVRKVDVWGDEDFLQQEFLDVLATLVNLRTFSISYPPSLASFQTLLVRLGALPSLRSLSVDFMSPRIWTVPVTFNHLRQLHLFCIEHEPGLAPETWRGALYHAPVSPIPAAPLLVDIGRAAGKRHLARTSFPASET